MPTQVASVSYYYYGLDRIRSLERFLAREGVFFDVDVLFECLRTLSFCIDSRLQGCLAPLTAGIKACLLAHDVRTHEIVEFAQFSSMESGDFATGVQCMGFSKVTGSRRGIVSLSRSSITMPTTIQSITRLSKPVM
ncbi:hypothetical protein [Paenirhodobacter populi]|uniref:hypothetical protein n=1 Tax=Paenirhodobacter populi TaxID=2306993 RepID=UPI000FE4001D|nr:hypothetical protein [Sinirhodobacter populi]RWR05828.1 hypothetical protein D2T32_15435 [Sinirhodobacter populi]